MMMYTIMPAEKNSSCHECGALALVLLVAVTLDENGYRDERALCGEHFKLTDDCQQDEGSEG